MSGQEDKEETEEEQKKAAAQTTALKAAIEHNPQANQKVKAAVEQEAPKSKGKTTVRSKIKKSLEPIILAGDSLFEAFKAAGKGLSWLYTERGQYGDKISKILMGGFLGAFLDRNKPELKDNAKGFSDLSKIPDNNTSEIAPKLSHDLEQASNAFSNLSNNATNSPDKPELIFSENLRNNGQKPSFEVITQKQQPDSKNDSGKSKSHAKKLN